MTRDEMIEKLEAALRFNGSQGLTRPRKLELTIRAVLAALHASPVGAEPPSLSAGDIATLTELADDLERIVQEVSSRDGDATARQHRRAEALRKAVHAFRIPAQAEPAAPMSGHRHAPACPAFRGGHDCTCGARRSTPSARPTPAAVPAQEK